MFEKLVLNLIVRSEPGALGACLRLRDDVVEPRCLAMRDILGDGGVAGRGKVCGGFGERRGVDFLGFRSWVSGLV